MRSVIFWIITQCSSSEIYRRFGETHPLITCFLLVLLSVYFSTMETIFSSETSVYFYQTLRGYSPEYRILQVCHFRPPVVCNERKIFYNYVIVEVLTAMTMKNAVFRDVAPCRLCVNRRFGRTYRLYVQGRKIRE
jgi:hypothetical protein